MRKLQNFFRPETVISIFLDEMSTVTINLFDETGKRILSVIENFRLSAGKQEIKMSRNQLKSGIYIAKITIENSQGTFKENLKVLVN